MLQNHLITIDGPRIVIAGELPFDLCTQVVRPEVGSGSGSLVAQDESLLAGEYSFEAVRIDKPIHTALKTLRPHAGLLPLVCRVYEKAGIQLDVESSRDCAVTLPSPIATGRDSGIVSDPLWLDFVQACAAGIVEHGRSVSVLDLVAQLISAYPTEPIAIVAKSDADAKEIATQLSTITDERVAYADRSYRRPTTGFEKEGEVFGDRVVVGHPKSLTDDEALVNKRSIVLFMDASALTHVDAEDMLCYPDFRARVFGFLPTNAKLTQREQDLIAAKVGFERLHIPAHGQQAVDVRTEFVHYNSRVHDPKIKSPRRARRLHINENRQRNCLIADLARGISGRPDLEDLHQERLGTPVVVCADVDHVAKLSWKLPRWPLVVAPGADLTGLDGAVKRRIRSWHPLQALLPDCPGVIATSTTLPALSSDRCRVLIWAGAGQEALELPESWLSTPVSKPMRRLVIDFRDKASPLLANWSKRRRKQYQQREWIGLDQDRVELRIKQAYSRMIRGNQGGTQ